MNTATEYSHYKSGVANSYSIKDFASELIQVLPKSPKAFTYMLKLAFQNTFPFTEDDIHSLIDVIAENIPTDKLQQSLSDINCSEVVSITRPPLIATELNRCLDAYGIGIALLLARHKYGDLSDTNPDQVKLSHEAIYNGSGIFTTEYTTQGYQVKVTTDISIGLPILELL
ncbi:hypothetical protein [Citrobacter sp. Cpo150]|uniref:hypothetical protein n=1 Tax=Citrobacter sp. Cpo150 TaxID=2985154 RepID=UPI002577B16B|nr:hypothetical protein [Citrobacter sp. Cpo150]MDM2765694.1 hypothetical protein [Citrobacter sp. Cpo150]